MTPPPTSSAAIPEVADGLLVSAVVEVAAPAPLFHLALRLEAKPCLVVGGGPVAARKAGRLLECGAIVTVVSPRTCALLDTLPVTVVRRTYRSGEAAAYGLVLAATGIAEVDRQVYLDAERAGVLVNAADDPASCSFLMPAVLRQGDVSVAVSTGGVSPWLAGWLRRRVGDVVGPEVATLTAIVGETRRAIRAAGVSSEGLDWGGLVDGALWPLLGAGDPGRARAVAVEWVETVLSSAVRPAARPSRAADPRGAGRPEEGSE